MTLSTYIRTIPDYPKPGILFRDITTLLKDPQGLAETIRTLAKRYRAAAITKVVGIESRGFIIGSALAFDLGCGFVPIRKRGKLPAATISAEYKLEYGTDHIEIHVDAIAPGDRVLLVDDLIATGGTAEAAIRLIQQLGGEIHELAFVVDLPDLGGRHRLEAAGHKVHTLCSFDGH